MNMAARCALGVLLLFPFLAAGQQAKKTMRSIGVGAPARTGAKKAPVRTDWDAVFAAIAADVAAGKTSFVSDSWASAEAAAFAVGSRWVSVIWNRDMEVSFDRETVVKSGSSVTVWMQTKFSKAQRSSSGEAYIEDMGKMTFYCDARQYATVQFIWRNSAGGVVYSSPVKKNWELERRDIVPATVGETEYELACQI